MKILVTNDDGINAAGIIALEAELQKIGQVTVVAPDSEQSAVGHAITLSDPLRVKQLAKHRFAVSGTPADCVKLAIRTILKSRPDVVVSGINLGPNTGYSVLYSGTVSGATEAAILGLPAFAISLNSFSKPDYSVAARFAAKLAKLVVRNGLPKKTLLNVNVPALPHRRIRGVRITRQSETAFVERFEKRSDPRKRLYYWLTGEIFKLEGEEESDSRALYDKHISITPLRCDMTDHSQLEELKNWAF
jgi:5'-nucleotidase